MIRLSVCLLLLLPAISWAREIDVVAQGAQAIGVVLHAPTGSLVQDEVRTELTWRIDFNGVLSVRDLVELPSAAVRSLGAKPIDASIMRNANAELVVTAALVASKKLQIAAYRVGQAAPIIEQTLSTQGRRTDLYDAAANLIYDKIVGQRGPFGEMLYFQKREDKSRTRELARMQLGFAVEQRVTLGQRIVIKPRSSVDGKHVVFIGYANAVPEIWQLEVATGRLSRPVPNSAPAYGAVKVGNRFVYSHANGRYAELLSYASGNRTTLQPASSMNLGIDVFPDDSGYVFTSDRFGNPHIFSDQGGSVRRLTIDGDYNASPKVSPDGQWVAFARREGGRFSIFAVTYDGKTIRRLTDDAGTDEDPVWSNDGRTIYFSSDRNNAGNKNIYSVDLWTGKINQITTSSGDERMPDVLRRLQQ